MTKQQKIKLFKESVRKWQEYFGLCDWEIFTDDMDEDDARARASWNYNGRIATIYYDNEWINRKNMSKKEIDRVAFHECAEIYFYFIHHPIKDQRGKDYAEECVHKVIRLLENKILGIEPE